MKDSPTVRARFAGPALLDAACATAFVALTGGQFLASFASQLGVTGVFFALLTSLNHLTTALQPLAAPRVQQADRKSLCIAGSFIARFSWLAVLATALTMKPGPASLAVFLALVLSNTAAAYSANAWLTWVSDLLPAHERPAFFARRNIVVSVTNMAAVLAGGWYLDWHGGPDGFLHLFAAGIAFGTLSLWALARHPRPALPPAPRLATASVTGYVLLPLRDASFRQILAFKTAWCFVVGIAAPLWLPHMLDVLRMTHSQVSAYNLCGLAATVLFSGLFARLASTLGNRPTLLLCATGIATNPLWWLLPDRGYLTTCWFEGFWSGAWWSGFNLILLNLAIELAPQASRPIYLALFQAAEGLAFLGGAVAGGWLATFTTGFAWHGAGLHLGPYHPVFILSSVGRFVTIAVLLLPFAGVTLRPPRALPRPLPPALPARRAA